MVSQSLFHDLDVFEKNWSGFFWRILQFGYALTFFSRLDWGSGEEQHREEVPFSLRHIRDDVIVT